MQFVEGGTGWDQETARSAYMMCHEQGPERQKCSGWHGWSFYGLLSFVVVIVAVATLRSGRVLAGGGYRFVGCMCRRAFEFIARVAEKVEDRGGGV